MYSFTKIMSLLLSVIALSACGGGGDSTPPLPQSKMFTVSLNSVDITRASNGDTVTVDTSSTSSDTSTYTP
jgi:hypothetical protein